MANKTFIGFSTGSDAARIGRSWALYDVDLINQDLLNHFHTRKGERIMRPEFGCSIWDLLMEQQSIGLRAEVTSEVRRICALDSRVTVNDVKTSFADNSITVSASLTYLPSRTVRDFTITFDNNSQEF